MTLQAVFFDMGGTIETFWHDRELRLAATGGLNQILVDAGIDLKLDDEELYTLVTEGLARYNDWRKHTLIELPAERVWQTYILAERPGAAQKVTAAVGEDLTYYVETQYYRREIRPEIPQVLEAIKNMGLNMGVISNVQSQRQVPRNLEQYGIIQYFDPIVLSCVYGRRKPDPAVFHHAARRMGVPTGACLYVGDRISRDVAGARRAGFDLAVQIKHDFAPDYDDTGPAPDAVLDDMTGLLDILETQLRCPAPRENERVRAVLFDAGDILYFRPRKHQELDAFLADLGLGPAHSLAPGLKRELKLRAFCGEVSREDYCAEMLKLYGVQGQEHIERGKQIMAQETGDVQFFEGVRETLAALKEQGLLLGIVTDTVHPTSVKLGWFERAGIGHFWDSIISSCSVGLCKPEPAIYRMALAQLGVEPDEALFVGHKKSELDGARAVGLGTIAFNYEDQAQADVYIEHFSGLVRAVSEL